MKKMGNFIRERIMAGLLTVIIAFGCIGIQDSPVSEAAGDEIAGIAGEEIAKETAELLDFGTDEAQREELEQKELEMCVSYGGDHIFCRDGLVWVKGQEGRLMLSPKNDYAERYDTVLQADEKGELRNPAVNLTTDGIAADSLSKMDKLYICLAKKDDNPDSKIGYRNVSSALEVPFKVDEEAPAAVFDAPLITEKVMAAGGQAKKVSFGLFSQVIYSAGFTVKDTPGAGVKSVKTCV